MPPHHVNKARRIEQILAAARELMSEGETPDFSMDLLAQRAGLSIATPYKLIGSKNQIIVALHAWETNQFQAHLKTVMEGDPISRLMRSIDEATNLHLSDERYFKALCRAAFSEAELVQGYYRSESERYFVELLKPIVEAGQLQESCDIALLARVMSYVYLSCTGDWSSGVMSSRILRDRMGYGIAICLLGVVAPSQRDRMHDLVLRHQAAIQTLEAAAKSGEASGVKTPGAAYPSPVG